MCVTQLGSSILNRVGLVKPPPAIWHSATGQTPLRPSHVPSYELRKGYCTE